MEVPCEKKRMTNRLTSVIEKSWNAVQNATLVD